MDVVISMLRAVNVGGHNKIKMDALRTLYESLDLRDVETHIQSGNVIFRTAERDLVRLTRRIEKAIEQKFGFRPDVIVRTSSELRSAIAKNPFAGREIDSSKLLVTFLASDPGAEACEKILRIEADPEELRIDGREIYIYFPNGMGRPKLSWASIGKTIEIPGTGRNWNTVIKLLGIAERLEALR